MCVCVGRVVQVPSINAEIHFPLGLSFLGGVAACFPKRLSRKYRQKTVTR